MANVATKIIAPATPLQQSMLYHALAEPHSGVDVEQVVCSIRGPLDAGALRAAWLRVVARHPALRTAFEVGGALTQVIAESCKLPFTVQDFSALPAEEREAKWAEALREDRRRGFDLNVVPLLRVAVFAFAPDEHRVLWTFHHAILDGRALTTVLREVFAILDGAELPPAPRPFHEHAAWLSQRDPAASESYWKAQLAGFLAPTPVVVDHLATGDADALQADADLRLTPSLTAALRDLAAADDFTLNNIVQGAWSLLLSRYSGEADIVFGATRACRHASVAGAEDMVGLLINTLPVRVRIEARAELLPWLRALRQQWIAMREHEHTPLARVQAWSCVPAGQPLFHTLVVFEAASLSAALGREVRLYENTGFPLTLAAYGGDELLLRLSYDPAAFDPATIQRMLGHLRTLLEGFATTPHARLGDFALVSPDERASLLAAAIPAPPVIAPRETTLHALFAEQAARAPDAIAVTCEDARLTYRELDSRASALAFRLRQLGAARDTLIGLYMERGVDLVVGLVAILKAGAAYLPIDPTTPPERAAFMLADARSPVLLTQRTLAAKLPPPAARVLCIEDFEPAGALPGEHGAPDDLAYAIYTSGSTGKPKGVQITHRNVVRLFSSTQHWFRFDGRDVWSMFHSIAFDFSVWEIWGALLHGGRVVIVPYAVSRSPEAFQALLLREQVTVLNQTPSAFRQLIAAEESSASQLSTLNPELSPLRLVILGGEALEMRSLQPWFARHGDARPQLVNMYGITETTVHVTYRALRAGDVARGSVIGQPLPDLELHILDAALRPVPIGVPGELHVGGAGLARGYVDRPDLTAERFIPHPCDPAARLYRTGDLARRLPDGDIEYLGRIDQQVQLRGFRIELGEIESALATHPAIREAAVIAREDATAGLRLLAYLVAQGTPPDVSCLREHLRRSLPDYMLPAAFVFLEKMPLTANGKLDRRALPEPEPARPEIAAAYVAPRTPAEQTLATIWQRVLRLERVGVHDNFFELGGDSILSILIITQARQAGLALNPRHLFDHQTIAGLAAAAPATTVAPSHEIVTGEVPLTPIQRWFFARDFAGMSHWNQAFIFDSAEPLDPAILSRAVAAVAAHHPAFRLRFTREGDAWTQCHAHSAGECFSQRDAGVFDLSAGPLFCVTQLGSRRLLIAAHHLCIDGVSWRILIEDLEAAYRQLRNAQAVQLPPESTSFQRWSRLLAAASRSPSLAAELPHWHALAAFRPTPLPRDHARGENTEASARTATASLTPEETDALLQRLPAATGTRINDALLTALGQTLAEWTGSDSVLLDMEGHGREESLVAELLGPDETPADLSRTIGWFTSIFPVRLDIPQSGALAQVRDQLRAIPRRGLGYGLQGAGAPPPRILGAKREHPRGEGAPAPCAEVLFNYLGQFGHTLAGSDLFRLSADSAGAWHSPRALRTHALEINCLVVGGRLEARWSYSENLHDAATVERLAARFCDAIRTLLAECGEESHALSPMQQLFLTLESAQPNAGFDQWHFALRGALDVERFRRAWCAVFQRHTILRTAFVAGDEPRQVVSRHVEPPLRLEDLRALPSDTQQQRLAAFLREDAERGFDLAQPPLTRLALLRLGDDEWRFVWSHHHLQIDGWSWPLLFREVGALYAGRTLPPARPYGDFIAWQQRRPAVADESFWRAHLRGFARTTPLPGKGGKAVHEETRALEPEVTAALGELARRQKTTLNVLVQAAWALLLSRHSGERDVVFGASFAGRSADLPGVEGIAGPFVNNLPVRARIDAAAPLAELLRAMHSELFELNEHQFTPLAQIHSWSELPWHARLFESLLVFQNYVIGDDAFRLGDDAILADAVMPVRTNYPLTIVAEQGAQLRLTVIASAQAAAEVCAQLATVLGAMAAADTPGALLDLLPARRTLQPERRPSADYAPPQTDTERAIAALWQEAFGLERVGVRDNFFDLGGHSLLMVRVHARLRDALKTDISIVRMFQHPTIQSLARHLDGDPRAAPVLAGVQARAEKQKAVLQRQRFLSRKP